MKERINKVEKEKTIVPRITKELDGYVGFANFPNQVYRKAIKKGFEFTLMVVGECVQFLRNMFFFLLFPMHPPSLRLFQRYEVCLLFDKNITRGWAISYKKYRTFGK